MRDLQSFVASHMNRHYRFLFWEYSKEQVTELLSIEIPGIATWEIKEAGQVISRFLYRLSRESGWKKVSAKERARYGYTGPQWIKADRFYSSFYPDNGVGAETLRAANGKATEEMWR